MGRTERHGEIIEQMLGKHDHDHNIATTEDFQTATRQCCQAKNSLSRVNGYTPEILLLGKKADLCQVACVMTLLWRRST